MNVLTYLPNSISVQNKIGMLARTAHYNFVPCMTESEALEKMLALAVTSRCLLFVAMTNLDLARKISIVQPQASVVVLLDKPLQKVARELLDCMSVRCFVAQQNEGFDAREILTMLRKFSDPNFAGVEKYLSYGASIQGLDIVDVSTKRSALERVEKSVSHLGNGAEEKRFQEYARRVSELVDELVLNAIFDANPAMRDVSRSLDFSLLQSEAVQVRWGFDGEVFAVSVRDYFGNLSKETIIEYLAEGHNSEKFWQDRKSAGLGFRLVFERMHQFIVNVEPGKMTEIICLLRFEKRFRDFDSRLKSFHYFVI